MRYLSFVVLIPALLAAGPATTQATQPAQEKPQIHGLNVGLMGPDGWCEARSTGDGFTVAMPQQYNDMSVSARDDDGSIVRTHMVATTMSNGTRFSVSVSVDSSGALAAGSTEKYADMLGAKGTVRNRHAVKMDGVDGVELEVVQPAQITRYRVAQRGNTIYLMTLRRFGLEIPKDGESIATRFFESFHFRAPDAEKGPARRAVVE